MNKLAKRALGLLGAGTFGAAALAGCAGGTTVVSAPMSAPPYYGQGNICWYYDSPDEVQRLIDQLKCPIGSIPQPMPDRWRSQYDWYWRSSSYIDTFVPEARRKVFVVHLHAFESQHSQDIVTSTPKVKITQTSTKKKDFNRGDGKATSTTKKSFDRGAGKSATSATSATSSSAVRPRSSVSTRRGGDVGDSRPTTSVRVGSSTRTRPVGGKG